MYTDTSVPDSFLDIVRYRVADRPEKAAYTFLRHTGKEVSSHTVVSYESLHLAAQSIAARLQSLERTGKRALLLYPPGLEFIQAFLGCLYAGVVAVPANPPRRNHKLTRLHSIVKDAEATLVLTVDSQLSVIQRQFNNALGFNHLQWLATDTIDKQLADEWQVPHLSTDHLAFLQYTSGSTGAPKGVMVSHGNLLHNEQVIRESFGHTQASLVLGWLPVFHDMGLVGNILQPLYMGCSCILFSPTDFLQQPIRWLQAISDYRVTTSGGPNFAYDLCTQKISEDDLSHLDLSSWELAFCGAEPIRGETLSQFIHKFAPYGFDRRAFFPCYGMAETTLMVSGGPKEIQPKILEVDTEALSRHQVQGVQAGMVSDTRVLVSCGAVHSDLKVVIVDPNTHLPCSPNRVGEIWVAGPSVALGYWQQPEATDKSFQACLDATGEGPFLRTGDMGFLYQDELFVTGRLKDILIVRGQNYYPQDIELTVEQSNPALRSSSGAAFIAEIKSTSQLVIVQEVERSYLRRLDRQEVIGDIRQAVVAEHGLLAAEIILVKPGKVPKTSSGKIQRYACCAAFLKGSLVTI